MGRTLSVTTAVFVLALLVAILWPAPSVVVFARVYNDLGTTADVSIGHDGLGVSARESIAPNAEAVIALSEADDSDPYLQATYTVRIITEEPARAAPAQVAGRKLIAGGDPPLKLSSLMPPSP